jgi:hypothetical protein
MSPNIPTGRGSRFIGALVAVLIVVTGLPALLVAVAVRRFGHISPLHGVNAPWRWTIADLRSWGRRLTDGLGSSNQLVDLFFRIALVIGWICVAILIYTVVDEVAFQVRHGMPSSRRRRLVGLGPLGRRLASALVAVLPLVVSATPSLAGPPNPRPATAVIRQHRDTVVLHEFAPPAGPIAAPATIPPRTASGWSLVEVRRGDSVWSIAERLADGGDVAAVAQQIVGANLGLVMNDGHRFSTPALIEAGWLLNVPIARALPSQVVESEESGSPAGDTYVVERGDSYWKIAEDHLEPMAGGVVVAAYTDELMAINAPLLNYSDGRMICPGDVVHLGSQPIAAVDPLPPAALPPVDVPPAVAAPLPSVVSPPPAVAALPASTGEPATVTTFPPPMPTAQPGAVSVDKLLFDEGVPVKRSLGGALLLAAGAIAVLDARRRQQLRGAQIGARLLAPTDEEVETEMLLRSLSAAERLARLDLALRCAAPALARQQARVLAAEIADDGEIRVYTDRPAVAVADRWLLDIEAGAWRLPSTVSLVDLAGDARDVNQPCPAIVHIGESAGGHLFVDLEAVGVLGIDAPPAAAASIVRCAAASLAVSPFLESSRIFTVGLGVEVQLGSPNVESHESLGSAAAAVRDTVGSIALATSGGVTTVGLRCAAHGGEAWEPSLLLAAGADDPGDLAALVSLAAGGGRGIGVMFDHPVVGSGAVLRAVDGDFVLEPLGRRVSPVGLSESDISAVDDLLDRAEWPLLAAVDDAVLAPPIIAPAFCGRQHELVVNILGQVAVLSADGVPVGFDRSKAQELVVWLSQHRHHPTRTSARTALWELAVRDATFSNVVSDARRAMARVVPPPAGQEWIGRTMNEDLPLHELVVSDVELLEQRVAAARGLDDRGAIEVLRPGVALIHGMPFEGTSYLWPDAEGITSSLVLLATSAAAQLAAHYLAIGDVDGVFWATGHGLKVLAGHEELIALRMRAHADRGDLAGVRSEWESYERAVQADTWAAAEPSPKLVELRRLLLSPSLAS